VQAGKKRNPQTETLASVTIWVSEDMKAFQAAVGVFDFDAFRADTAVVRLFLFGQWTLFRLFLRSFAVFVQFFDALVTLVSLNFYVLHDFHPD